MINTDNVQSIIGAKVLDQDNDKIGTVEQVYLDDADGHPSWASVRTGLFGTSETFVPLDKADFSGDELRVPFEKAFVKDAPRVDADQSLSPEEEDELYRYYGLGADETSTHSGTNDYADTSAGMATTGGADTTGLGTTDTTGIADGADTTTGYADSGAGHDVSGPDTDSAMTRSEEHLRVGTEDRVAGRARLRKYVVTENETVTVPVSREEVRLEREPITDANAGAALDGPAISEEEHEVVLHEERPVVETEAVPVERVRASTDTVTEQETVTGEVRKEQITLDADGTTDRDR